MPQLPHEKFAWRHDRPIKVVQITAEGVKTEFELSHTDFMETDKGLWYYYKEFPNELVFKPWHCIRTMYQDKSDDTGTDTKAGTD